MSSGWTSTGPYEEVLSPEVAVQLPCAQGQINRLIKLGCEVEIMGNKLIVRSPSRLAGADDQSTDESDREIESQLSVAQGQIDKLNKLGADVELVGNNTLVVRPSTGAQRLDIRAELLDGNAALDFLDNPEVADVVIVCGRRHFRAYTPYLTRWSEFFKTELACDRGASPPSFLTVDPPSPTCFHATLEYLYVGTSPLLKGDAEEVFGLLGNGHYLGCDALIKACLRRLHELLMQPDYKDTSLHPDFNSRLVPHVLVLGIAQARLHEVHRIDITLDWLAHERERTRDGEAVAVAAAQLASSHFLEPKDYQYLMQDYRAVPVYREVMDALLKRACQPHPGTADGHCGRRP